MYSMDWEYHAHLSGDFDIHIAHRDVSAGPILARRDIKVVLVEWQTMHDLRRVGECVGVRNELAQLTAVRKDDIGLYIHYMVETSIFGPKSGRGKLPCAPLYGHRHSWRQLMWRKTREGIF